MYIYAENNVIKVISSELLELTTCTVENLPEDFYYYLQWGKYLANENGIYIADGWVDFTDTEKTELQACIDAGTQWVRDSVPKSITRYQGVMYLHSIGKLAELEAKVIEQDGAAEIAYYNSITWNRDNAFVIAIAAYLNMTETDIDEFFVNAAKIE